MGGSARTLEKVSSHARPPSALPALVRLGSSHVTVTLIRRFAVPVHALTIAIGMNVPMHGLYEALLDACIARSAVYEVALLLPHMIHHAYTLTTSVKASPGPSYLPTLSRKVSTTSPALGSRWQTTVNKAATSVHVWLDWAAGEDAGQEQVERRWLGDAMDGLVCESRDAAGAALLVEVVRTMVDHPARETMSELLVQRLSTWSQYAIFLSNTLRLRDSCSEVVAAIDASLNELADLLHEQLTPIDRQPIATALLALDLHSLWTQSLVAPTENSTPATPPRLPRDTLQFCFLPHILSSHVTISTVLSLATTLRMVGTLPTIESGLLQCAIAEYDRLSPFADSTILSPEEQMMAAIGLEELSDLATDAEKRRLAVDIGAGGTPGGTAKGMRWEEMVGAWVEATPQGRPTKVARRRVVLSPLTDYETSDDDDREEQSDEDEQSDDPMDALDGSSGDEREIVVRKEVRGLKRMGRMSLDGPSSIASEDEDEDDHALEEEVLQQVTSVGDSESDEDTHSDAPVEDNFVRDDSTAPSSSSTARPSSSPPPPPTRTRQPTKRPRNSPLPPPITSATRFPPIPPQPLFISSNPKLNATLPAARDRRLSQLILTRPPHPQARRTHTSLPDPDTAGVSTPVRSGKAPPAWLHSRFSPAAGSPLRRISGGPGTARQQRSTQRLHHPTAASSLVPHSPSPLQSTPHGASRMNAAQAFSRLAPTSAHKWTYLSPRTKSATASAAAPIVHLLASSSPSKIGSPSPVRKKLRLRSKATAANQLPPSSDPVADSKAEEDLEDEQRETADQDEGGKMSEQMEQMERDEESAPPSSEADDMDLFAASSPVLPVKTMRRSRGVLKMAGSGRGTTGGGAGGMREKLGRKRVGWGLTREEV